MKRYLYILAIPLFLLNCKKDEVPDPLPTIKELVGRWRLVATETTVDGEKVWESATASYYLIFRFDGVILNENGNRPCCTPGSLIVNGVPFTIKPLAPVSSEFCGNVSCLYMPNLILQQNADTLIVTPGIENPHYRSRYLRE
ncbi:hypothetical protein [Salmonirosea aquatica]|uniref:Lipocalin-like domain-containing protein n=1 Tax=Salmonirosea aquatica TaxID=2654236 RepID=A0A7C9BHB3_9BACT|nr:hypothetical protein [Cytophagaceae bacterium SJW1-29]